MTISTVTTAMSEALARAARMVARWLPNERSALGRAQGQPHGHQGEDERTDIGEVVAGIGQQPGGVGDQMPKPIWTTTKPGVERRD